MQIFCLMLAFSFRTSILHLFFMCLRNILNNSIWQNNFPGHKSQNFLHFSRFPFFSSRPNTIDFIDNTYHTWKLLFSKKLYVWIFILRKTTSEIQCKNEKDKYFAICQKDKNYIFIYWTLVHYTMTTNILVSRGTLRPVRQENSGDTNLQLHHTHILQQCYH